MEDKIVGPARQDMRPRQTALGDELLEAREQHQPGSPEYLDLTEAIDTVSVVAESSRCDSLAKLDGVKLRALKAAPDASGTFYSLQSVGRIWRDSDEPKADAIIRCITTDDRPTMTAAGMEYRGKFYPVERQRWALLNAFVDARHHTVEARSLADLDDAWCDRGDKPSNQTIAKGIERLADALESLGLKHPIEVVGTGKRLAWRLNLPA